MGRVAALEHPRQWAGLVDLPVTVDSHTGSLLASVLAADPSQPPPEDQVAIRPSGLHARRLQHAPSPSNGGKPWKPTGTTLITGGTGALATHIATWLTEQGAPHILLASRSGTNAPTAQHLTALANDTTQITITSCDITDPQQTEQLLHSIPAQHPLTTVIHTAGVAENAPLDEFTTEHANGILGPKSHAAYHLHQLTKDRPDLTLVLFSSGSATWGSSRQATYAAANAYLDALAEHRTANSLPTTSIAWAPWNDIGMAADPAILSYYTKRGLRPLDPDLAVKALHHALTHPAATITVADIDWRTFPAPFTTHRPSPLLTHLTPQPTSHGDTTDGTNPLTTHLNTLNPQQQHQHLLTLIQTHTATTLGHPTTHHIPPHQPFQQHGLDSLTAIQLRNTLTTHTTLPLPPPSSTTTPHHTNSPPTSNNN
nr:beta-ketoacyl reductase [Phytohabitans suffuscus]